MGPHDSQVTPQSRASLCAECDGRICRRHRLPASRRVVCLLHERQFDTVGRQPGAGALVERSRSVRPDFLVRDGCCLRQPGVLLVEAMLLALAALCYAFGVSNVAVAAMVLAMGLENAVFQIDGGAGLGLTYVTGALVKVGQLVAAALTGGERWGWLPNLLLWAALVAGAVCGASAYHWINLAAVWFAAALALILSGIVAATARS